MNFTTPADDFAGDEFSNNLFSDLAPLLTLFGEQVTKQFLSLSLGWADNFLLSMGPLGIMTIIVSAIRVGGVKKLKAVVGRARESRSTAELELLSSTSADVCELWSGQEIVRLIGNPQMKWLILDKSNGELHDLQSASKARLIRHDQSLGHPDGSEVTSILKDAAPNLALNVRHATASSKELWFWAIVGIGLQATAIVIPGLATYRWAWLKAGAPVAGYGYPCFLVGTLLVIVGILGCGHVIEGITTEYSFEPAHDSDLQPLVLQRSVTVADQHFSSYAIFFPSGIRTSTLASDPKESYFSILAAASTLTALVGFVIQFVGLRALHWSATILQLGITLVMTGVRAWARRGLAFDPTATTILDGHEKAWLALHLWAKKTTGATQSSTAASGEEVDITPAVQEQGPVKDGWDEVSKVTKLFHNEYRSFISPSARPDLPEGEQTLPQYVPHLFYQNWSVSKAIQGEVFWEPYTGLNGTFLELLMVMMYQYSDRGVPRLQSGFRSSTPSILPQQLYTAQHLFGPVHHKGLPRVWVHGRNYIESGPTEKEAMSGYARISNLMPTADDIVPRATTFTNLAERILGYLATSNHVRWKGFGTSFTWSFTVCVGKLSLYRQASNTSRVVSFRLEAEVDNTLGYATTAHTDKWSFQQPNLVQGFIAIWLFTLARRRAAIRDVISNPWIKELMFRHEYIGPLREAIGPESELRYLRIIGTPGAQTDAVERWIGVTTTGIKTPNGGTITQHGSCSPIFGLYLSSVSSCRTEGPQPQAGEDDKIHRGWTPDEIGRHLEPEDDDIVFEHRAGIDVSMRCVQELVSLFVLAIASNITVVGGTTRFDQEAADMELELRRPQRSWTNTVFTAIANEIVDAGIARDLTEAFVLVIPAFAYHNLLPREEGVDVSFDSDTSIDGGTGSPGHPNAGTSLSVVAPA